MDLERSHFRQIFTCLKNSPHAPSHFPSLGLCPQAPLEILYGTALYSGVPVVVWMRDITQSLISIIHADNLPRGSKFVACLPLSDDVHLELVCRVTCSQAVGTRLHRLDAHFESIVEVDQHHMPAAGKHRNNFTEPDTLDRPMEHRRHTDD